MPAPPEQPQREAEDRDGAGHRAGEAAGFGEDVGSDELHVAPGGERVRASKLRPHGGTCQAATASGGAVFRGALTDVSGCLQVPGAEVL